MTQLPWRPRFAFKGALRVRPSDVHAMCELAYAQRPKAPRQASVARVWLAWFLFWLYNQNMGRPKNTEERRAQIVEGLLLAMAEHGYEGASIPRIAEAAGLAPGLVHYHFASKLDILLSLVDSLSARIAARFAQRAAQAQSPRRRLYAFLDAYVALGADADPRAVACWVAIGAEALRHDDVQKAYKKAARAALEQLESLVRAALRDEDRITDATADIAAALLSSIYGCYQLALAAHAAPRGFAAPMLRRMADGLLSAQPEACA